MATLIKSTFLIILSSISCCFAQSRPTELKIGDQLPNLEVTLNTGKKINLSDLYRDAPLIIDFWATWCVPCIREIRLTDSLKKVHPGKFNVLLVSSQSQKTINEFLVRPTNKDLSRLSGAVVSADTLLTRLFPHKTIPHNVWIDSSGTVRAITSGEEITEDNLLRFSAEPTSLKLTTKKDRMNFRLNDAFHLGDSSFTYRSIISPNVSGIPSGELSPIRGQMQKYAQFNTGELRTLWGAYSRFNPGLRPGLIELHTRDSSRFFAPKVFGKSNGKTTAYTSKAEWDRDNLFCYSLSLQTVVPDSTFANYIFQDIERGFQIRSYIVPKMTNCLVLTRASGTRLPPTIAEKNKTADIRFTKEQKLIIQAATIDDLLDFLFRTGLPEDRPFPYINETDYSKSFRFDLEIDFSKEPGVEKTDITIAMIYRRLAAHGLNFSRSLRRYPILVIHDLKK